jgi:hypothetical protein
MNTRQWFCKSHFSSFHNGIYRSEKACSCYRFTAHGECCCDSRSTGWVDVCACKIHAIQIACGTQCWRCLTEYNSSGTCTCSGCGASYDCINHTCSGSSGVSSGGYGSSTSSSSTGGGTSSTTTTSIMQSATRILANSRIVPANVHVSKIVDGADAKSNLIDTKNGFEALRSDYENAPGERVALSQSLLNGIETLSLIFSFSISEIAGGSHSVGSSHYDGVAVDINVVNGIPVRNMSESQVNQFRNGAFNAGAIKVYDPYHDPYGGHSSHFHISWKP